jgi:hypothetical protein
MSLIGKLKFVSSKREVVINPVIARRNKLAAKLAEQLQAATAQRQGIAYAPKRTSMITNDAGELVAVVSDKRFKEWYWTTSANKINLCVRYGSKTLELAKGRNAIELNTRDELIDTLTVLQQAVLAGELDDAIAAASDKLRAGFGK